jgi:hypothetical protein
MSSYGLLDDLTNIYQKERLEEARKAKLVEQVRAGKPPLRDRFLLESGEYLISIGQRLKSRHELKIQPRPVRRPTISDGTVRDGQP